MKPLSVIIVSWNTREMLEECLRSLYEQPTRVPFVTYVVDNASVDGSSEMVRNLFPQVELVENEENVGFAKANNQILRQVVTPYALLLNSDTIIPKSDVFGPWIDFMEKHPECAASGCRLTFPDGSQQVGDAGYRPSLKTVLCHALFFSRLFPEKCKGIFLTGIPKRDGEIDVDWVCGAAMMVRMSIVRRVGYMDEGFFMFAEDIEWGCRMKEAGYRVCYLPWITIVHLQGVSSGKQKIQGFSSLWLRNVRKIFERYNPGVPGRMCDVLMGLGLFLRALLYFVAGEKYRNKARRMFHYFEDIIFRKV
ncbi:glycosyltransferase family 2 protein [Thermodesulforhabdus norvegica]|uniref:Glycosyltransferase 2-like domain-containing protein n=1 Tax=Thermodesulforhabdus norvegica TaxID=39841 RepID=A0A1I4U7H5_9BACT|nr:glycosyltransferase family 2 protein [Thermodesulforhabdus norvegica]SFM84976.1 hypothetical protein SAMN05660836_01688 [Thermodesulforhabdus norvegica]